LKKIERFEDIIAWQKARVLNNAIYNITNKWQFHKDMYLKDQLIRSSNSIMANIAEGYSKYSAKGFKNYLNISRSSAAEFQSHLYVALDQKYYNQSGEISKIISGLIKYLKQQESNKRFKT
jgi:four helix bundle protein